MQEGRWTATTPCSSRTSGRRAPSLRASFSADSGPALLPKVDGAVARVGDNEWIALPDAWVVNAHRS